MNWSRVDSASFWFVLGCVTGIAITALIAYNSGEFVSTNTLRRNGYAVVRNSETHGETSTNWVEVVRTDGRPL